MNTSSLFLFFILLLGALAVFYYFLRKLLLEKQSTDQQQKELEDMVNKVFGMTANKIALQSKTILAGEKDTIKTDLANKQEVIEKLVKQLQEN